MDIEIYSRTNKILGLAYSITKELNEIDIDYIIEKTRGLDWIKITNYYNKTSRQNLLSLYFVLWKIISGSNNSKLIDKFKFDDIIIKKLNNGLQNMLWEILEPNDMELS